MSKVENVTSASKFVFSNIIHSKHSQVQSDSMFFFVWANLWNLLKDSSWRLDTRYQRYDIWPMWRFTNLSFYLLVMSSTFHFWNFLRVFPVWGSNPGSFGNFHFLLSRFTSELHCFPIPFHQCAILSTCHFVCLSFHQCGISSM